MLVGITTSGAGDSSDAAGGAGASFSASFGALACSSSGALACSSFGAFASSHAFFSRAAGRPPADSASRGGERSSGQRRRRGR
jgi:hypothetical protein